MSLFAVSLIVIGVLILVIAALEAFHNKANFDIDNEFNSVSSKPVQCPVCNKVMTLSVSQRIFYIKGNAFACCATHSVQSVIEFIESEEKKHVS